MAVTISSSKFSFIRFEPVNFSLPAYKQFDSAFQFIINGFLPITNSLRLGVCNEEGEPVDVFLTPVYASFLSYKMKIPVAIFSLNTFYLVKIVVGPTEINYNKDVTYDEFKQLLVSDFGFNVLSDNTFFSRTLDEIVITYLTAPGSPAIENTLQAFVGSAYVRATGDLIGLHLEPHKCFRYFITDEDDAIVGRTNLFKVVATDRFTSRLIYSNNEDAFEFIYNGSEDNIVRLPLYCSRPQWPEKKTVYLKSNGQHKLLSASVEEQYSLKTDYLVKEMHRFLKIALAHDNISIDCPHMIESPVQIINTDSYQPQWDDEFDLETAQGKSTITVASFGYRNSNCDNQEVNCPAPILAIGTVTDTTAELQFQYITSVKKILINYRKVGSVDWQSVTINAAASYTLTGLATGYDYETRIASNCGTAYGDFGRMKTFRTTGITACAAPTNLVFLNAEGGNFTLDVDLPAELPADIELMVEKPDGFVGYYPFPTTGFTANPFLITLNEPTRQNGMYHFKVRSKCSPTNLSSYTNQVDYVSSAPVVTDLVLQYAFSLYGGNQGRLTIQKNGSYVVDTGENKYSALSVNAGDEIIAIVQSSGYIVPVRMVISTGTGPVVYQTPDSPASSFERFAFTVVASTNYFIRASI